MTELQVTINNLKDVLTSGNRLLFKLEKAQKDLEKSPPHKWEHGDVFKSALGTTMICVHKNQERLHIFCLSGFGCALNHSNSDTTGILSTATFLFNIREKL